MNRLTNRWFSRIIQGRLASWLISQKGHENCKNDACKLSLLGCASYYMLTECDAQTDTRLQLWDHGNVLLYQFLVFHNLLKNIRHDFPRRIPKLNQFYFDFIRSKYWRSYSIAKLKEINFNSFYSLYLNLIFCYKIFGWSIASCNANKPLRVKLKNHHFFLWANDHEIQKWLISIA